MLTVQNVNKEYRRGETPFFAVEDANLQVENSDFVCVTGRSGSGKSTLINLISGLLRPDSGSISLDGTALDTMRDDALSHFRNTHIGHIPQGHSLISYLSVLDNVRLPYYLYPRKDDVTARARDLLDLVGILHLQNDAPRNLSGGELKRVAIARSLICEPALLLADEPTSDLDSVTTAVVMKLFSEIHRRGTAVILVTHEENLIAYSNRHLIMENGRIKE
ncbi:MAG: ABC transporter ATP-binding protein [Clostridiales Family XIII bacterium]|jgi:putative ABC transport system ATP-binding protein|nr:ABC transporter ATP-binding protein [Clostridiales Family XIII bacterium]